VALERLVGQRRDRAGGRCQRRRVLADLPLRVRVHPKREETEEVVEVHLPVPLGVERQRQVDAGQLPGEIVLQQGLVGRVGGVLLLLEKVEDAALELPRHLGVVAALLVVGRLPPDLRRRGHVELVGHDAVAAGDLVEPRRPVADPLAGDEDRQLAVELEHDVLERRRVPVPHQVVDEPGILPDGLRAGPVGHARGLDDARVAAHVVDQPHEATVQNLDFLVQQRLGRRNDDMAHDVSCRTLPASQLRGRKSSPARPRSGARPFGLNRGSGPRYSVRPLAPGNP